jgi:two-component system, chemotaxis family, CheB/CheR fusion protein
MALTTGRRRATDRPAKRTATAARAASPRRSSIAVVGVGASAGGLDAFRKLLIALPANTGMAFVLIQHLDPTHESMMVGLLAGHTSMTLVQAADGMPIERNHVYLMPPRAYLAIRDGVLRLSQPRERHGTRMPFDFFLRSLAENRGKRAICAVLSGSGTDGSEGIKTIKRHGGLVIAQDPEEAAYDGMPRSAIATGAVDLVLSLAEVPAALNGARPSGDLVARKANVSPDRAPELLEQVVALLRTQVTHDFSMYKTGTLLRRIERRMAINRIANAGRYLAKLRKDPGELKRLAQDLLIHVTSFFRDPDAFGLLTAQIVPELIRGRAPGRPLRVWVPACSTGEEPYSIAMILLEAAEAEVKLQVFASDVDEDAVSFARNGLYPESIVADVSPARLARFFIKEVDGYRVMPALREAVVFTVQDLLANAPFSRLDLVSCRNLLIYLRPEAQQQTLSLFHFALREGGVLFLGASETVGSLAHHFEAIDEEKPLFRHIGSSRPGEVRFPIGAGHGASPSGSLALRATAAPAIGLGDLAQRRLLDSYAPASVLINRNHEGLFHFGAVDRYLRVASGDASRDVLAMARDGLRAKLRAAILQSRRAGARIVVTGAQVTRDHSRTAVDIAVEPVERGGDSLLLVSFIERPEPIRQASKTPEVAADATLVRQLEQELDATRQELQSAIRDLDLASEEHRAINEEALSVNEEYQSTNEELETSKEELQSLNQELTTLNAQLQETVAQQRATTSDMQNILNSSDLATLFLDQALRIRFFTPATTSLFRIITSDIGRPLADLAPWSDDVEVTADAQRVLSVGLPIAREIRGDNGAWYIRRVLPYRSLDGRNEGVVVTFTDMSSMKAVQQELETARAYSESIIDTVRQPLIVLDDALCLVSANRSFYSTFEVEPGGAVGRPFASQLDAPALQRFLERIRTELEAIEDHEIELDLPALGRRSLLVSARTLREAATAKRRILVAFDDVTDRKHADQALTLAKSQAERANRGKSRFLAAASHDLRQPLQTLSLLQGILMKRIKDAGTLRLVGKIEETLGAMSGMLNTLLDINQLEAGIVRPDVSDFPIAELLDRLRAEFSYHAESRKLGWRVVSSSAIVRSDPRLLEQMLRNLLSNAVKYTRQGKILLGCRRRGDTLRIEVRDTGIGIPADQLQAVFEEFHQLDNPARERALGLGLGLSILQRLANLLDHPIDVRSELGSGTVFAVEVPLGHLAAGERPVVGSDVPAHVTPHTGEILIVEDDPMIREMLVLLFEDEGHRTVAAADGREAFALAARGTLRPDLVIADYNLPGGLTGLQVAAALRTTLHNEVPVIIITGDISSDTLFEIAQQGCLYLHKPVKVVDLMRLTQSLIAPTQARAPAEKRIQTTQAPVIGSRAPTVFVVDDDASVREAIGETLEEHGRAVQLCASGEAFLKVYRRGQAGCLVVDARLPGMDGISVIGRLKNDGARLPAIMITGHGDVPMAVAAMRAGAVDFLEKPVGHGDLLASIERALTFATSSDRPPSNVAAASLIAELTVRERQVLDEVVAGHANKEIAARLGISQRTVENHRAAVMKRTKTRSLPDLIRLVMRAA